LWCTFFGSDACLQDLFIQMPNATANQNLPHASPMGSHKSALSCAIFQSTYDIFAVTINHLDGRNVISYEKKNLLSIFSCFSGFNL